MKNDPPKNPSSIQERLLKGAVDIYQTPPEKNEVSYQHKVLAQISLPYRDPGDDMTVWERYSGDSALIIRAGEIVRPRSRERISAGLPYGAKARILMIFFNQEAIRSNSPVINVEENMTAFIKKVHPGKVVSGRTINSYKEQLTRLSASSYTMAVSLSDDHVINENGRIVRGFDLWFPKDANQRVLWSSTVRLSDEYFTSLKRYLVPLDERAVGNLSNNAMALDIYAWLAQRLHWIPERKDHFIAWQNLKEQFGDNYKRMDKFKQVFRHTLAMVLTQYPAARSCMVEIKNKGYQMKKAQPPVQYTRPKQMR